MKWLNGSQVYVRSRWTWRSSRPCSEAVTCILRINGVGPWSRSLLQPTELHTCCLIMHRSGFAGWQEKIIAIDQRVEVRGPRDKALCRWMTSISSLVTWNNEQCWSGTNGHRRIYGRVLLLPPSNHIMSCRTVSLLFSCLHLCPTSPEGSVWAVRWWVPERQAAARLLPQASWSHLETQNPII